MTGRAMEVYLNDHLAGATLGCDLAEQIRKRHEDSRLGAVMASLAPQIDEDRQALLQLMEKMDISRNPLKQAGGWVAEKASRVKFSGAGSGESDHGALMALETLTLGVEGKVSMWKVLKAVQSDYPALTSVDLDGLIERAESQHGKLGRERLAAGTAALSASHSAA